MPRLREIFLFEVLIFRGNSPYLALITRRGKKSIRKLCTDVILNLITKYPFNKCTNLVIVFQKYSES